MKDLTAIHKTIIIVAFLAAIVALSLLGKDIAALVAVGASILAGVGISVAQGSQIQQQTNGAMKAKDEAFEQFARDTTRHMRELADVLARMQPPADGKL